MKKFRIGQNRKTEKNLDFTGQIQNKQNLDLNNVPNGKNSKLDKIQN